MIEAIRTISKKIDSTMFRYGNARTRVYMAMNRLDGGSHLFKPEDYKNLVEAASVASEWHDIISSTQTILGTTMVASSAFTESKLLRRASLTTGLLLLLAARGSLVKREQMQKIAEVANSEQHHLQSEEAMREIRQNLPLK